MYDPLVENFPDPHQSLPTSYWASTIDNPIETPELSCDKHYDVAVVGAGYTGMSTAYHIAKDYGKSVAIVEANMPGWGCSGRNAGFVLPGTGRLSLFDMAKRWGMETAQDVYAEYMRSIDKVQSLITLGNIQCDQVQGGYLKLAHRRQDVEALREQALKLQSTFGESVNFIHSKQASREYLVCDNMFGGIYFDRSFGVNPLKLAQGYCQLALDQGVDIYSHSPVVNWQQKNNQQILVTPRGTVTADKVVIATNGYTGKSMHSEVDRKHFPVMSSIMVTRPLTDSELTSLNFKPGLLAMDTRKMKYYYRMLPDNRILFGGRGAIKGAVASSQSSKQRLQSGLNDTFPTLAGIEMDYFWSGWVSATVDSYPRIYGDDTKQVNYAIGYCGAGLAFSSLAGQRMSQYLYEPDLLPNLPFWQSPLKTYPMSSMRRVGLSAYYALAAMG